MILPSIDINTSRSAQFRFACASSESTPVNAFPNGPLDGFWNERTGELLGFPQPQRLHDPVTGQRPPRSGTGGAVESRSRGIRAEECRPTGMAHGRLFQLSFIEERLVRVPPFNLDSEFGQVRKQALALRSGHDGARHLFRLA